MPVPPILSDAGRPVEERIEALGAWLREDDPAVDAYLRTFLEVQVRAGRPQDAHTAALKAAAGARPSLPRGLGGAEGIEAKPYTWRAAVELCLVAAGQRAARERSLLPALFRSLLLWPTREREIAMDALLALKPSAAEREAGLIALVDAIGDVKDEPGTRLLTIIKAGLCQPAWTVSLCQVLAGRHKGLRALQALRYAILPEPARLAPASWSAEEVASLRAVAGVGPALCRAIATLALAAAPDAVADEALLQVLADEQLPAWVRERAADWLIHQGSDQMAIRQVVGAVLAGKPGGKLPGKLTALLATATPSPEREPHREDGLLLLPLAEEIADGPVGAEGRAWLLLCELIRGQPHGAWRTHEERLTLTELSASGERLDHPVPLLLPSRPTGAADAQRRAEIALLVGRWLVLSLRVPFSDHRGWGTENHVLAWDLDARRWLSLARGPKGPTARPIDGVISEDSLPSWGGGELLLWRDGAGRPRDFNDGTPYHLDGVDPDRETGAAMLAARESDRGFSRIRRGQARLRSPALEDLILRRWDLEDALTLGGAEIGGVRVVALRSFKNAKPRRWLDSVAVLGG